MFDCEPTHNKVLTYTMLFSFSSAGHTHIEYSII